MRWKEPRREVAREGDIEGWHDNDSSYDNIADDYNDTSKKIL